MQINLKTVWNFFIEAINMKNSVPIVISIVDLLFEKLLLRMVAVMV